MLDIHHFEYLCDLMNAYRGCRSDHWWKRIMPHPVKCAAISCDSPNKYSASLRDIVQVYEGITVALRRRSFGPGLKV